jgi:hypothetical protein
MAERPVREVAELGRLDVMCVAQLTSHCIELAIYNKHPKLTKPELIARMMSKLCPFASATAAAVAAGEVSVIPLPQL